MAKAKAKAVVKGAAVSKIIATSVENLMAANDECAKAIASRSKDAKNNTTDSKKLAKKRATLLKRKKSASAKVKSDPGAATKKALKDVVKELSDIMKQSAKLKPVKLANATELAELKESGKALAAYTKALAKIDKVLSKPKKKKRKKKRAKAAA